MTSKLESGTARHFVDRCDQRLDKLLEESGDRARFFVSATVPRPSSVEIK